MPSSTVSSLKACYFLPVEDWLPFVTKTEKHWVRYLHAIAVDPNLQAKNAQQWHEESWAVLRDLVKPESQVEFWRQVCQQQQMDKLERIIRFCGDRLKVAGDILFYADFFFLADTEIKYDRALTDDEKRMLCAWRDEHGEGSIQDIEAHTKDFCQREAIPLRDLVKVVRYAISGKSVGPGLWESLHELGPRSVSVRIDCCIGCYISPTMATEIIQTRKAMGLM